jgi:hypothetical protein
MRLFELIEALDMRQRDRRSKDRRFAGTQTGAWGEIDQRSGERRKGERRTVSVRPDVHKSEEGIDIREWLRMVASLLWETYGIYIGSVSKDLDSTKISLRDMYDADVPANKAAQQLISGKNLAPRGGSVRSR